MRFSLLVFLVPFLLFACGDPSDQPAQSPQIEKTSTLNFDWLLGHWQRSDDQPGFTTYEQWTKASDSLYLGFSFRMEGLDTVWQEEMRLLATGNDWVLEASGEGSVVPFTLTETSANAFTSENPAHDFPKMITYRQVGDSLYAVISGEGMEVPFTFGKTEEKKD